MLEYGREDLRDGLAIELVAVHHVEVTNETRGDAGPASAWRTKRSEDENVLNLHELLVLAIVPTLMVQELT